jgi:heptosyltransferase-3
MAFLNINFFRKKITKSITYFFLMNKPLEKKEKPINKILISRPNHRLGNQLLITPLIQEIKNQFPEAKIYLLTKGTLSNEIFKNDPSIVKHFNLPKKHFKDFFQYLGVWLALIFTKFDLCINCDTSSSSGRISTMLPVSNYKINHEFNYNFWDFNKELVQHIAIKAIIDFRIYFNLNFNTEIPKLQIQLSEDERNNGKTIVINTKQNKELKTICIFTNATKNKCYDENWWKIFIESLNPLKNNYEIIELLPIENTSKVNFKYPTIYSTSIREMASIIENVDCFISGDCGVMHLASATNTTTIGLFKFNNIDKYKPYGNDNIAINTSKMKLNDVSKKIIKILN